MSTTYLRPGETPTAPPTPLMACCTSSIGPLCGHHVTIYGPAHFAPAYVYQLRTGMIADFERVMSGEVIYREVQAVRPILSGVWGVTIMGHEHLMNAAATVRVAGTDAVTRRRLAEMGVSVPRITVRPWVYGQPESGVTS